MRRYLPYLAIPVAFAAGMGATRILPAAHAADAPLAPQIIDVGALSDAELGPASPSGLTQRLLVQTPDGSVSIQAGNTPKHTHTDSVEIQYILSGSGKFWLGDTQRDVHPGDLIIVPKGVAHSGATLAAGSGPIRSLAIKLPPQKPGDAHMVN